MSVGLDMIFRTLFKLRVKSVSSESIFRTQLRKDSRVPDEYSKRLPQEYVSNSLTVVPYWSSEIMFNIGYLQQIILTSLRNSLHCFNYMWYNYLNIYSLITILNVKCTVEVYGSRGPSELTQIFSRVT